MFGDRHEDKGRIRFVDRLQAMNLFRHRVMIVRVLSVFGSSQTSGVFRMKVLRFENGFPSKD
jgi:hypothetical protein